MKIGDTVIFKRIAFLLVLALCLGLMASCADRESSTTVTSESEGETLTTNTDYHEHGVALSFIGKFQCASDYYKDEYFLINQASVPHIAFDEYGGCIMGINYLEGGCDIPGEYSIAGNEIEVRLDFSNSILESTVTDDNNKDFLTDVYKFSIIDENTISINNGCFAVNPGDIFVRIDN